MATILDAFKMILGLDASSFHEEIKKVKDELLDVQKEVNISVNVLKKTEDKKQDILDKSLAKRKKSRKKDTDDRKKEVEDEEKDPWKASEESKKAENEKTNTFVAALSKRLAVAYVAKKTFDVAKEGMLSAADFHRLAASMNDSDINMRIFSNNMELIGGNADEAKVSIASLQDRLSAFQLYGEGAEDLSRQLSYIGIGLRKSNGEMKTSLDLMNDIENYVKRNPKRLNNAMLYGTVSPFISRDMLYAMQNGKKEKAAELANIDQPKAALAQKAIEATKAGTMKLSAEITKKAEEGVEIASEPLSNALDYADKKIKDATDYSKGKINDIDAFFGDLKKKYPVVNSVPYSLMKSQAFRESSNNPNAVSNKGAKGLFQLMDPTFKSFSKGMSDANPFNPEHSAANPFNPEHSDANPFNPEHSTVAYANFMTKLHGLFGGWSQANFAYRGHGESERFDKQGHFTGKVTDSDRQYLADRMTDVTHGQYSYDNRTHSVTNHVSNKIDFHIDGPADVDAINKMLNDRLMVDTGGNNTGMAR